MQTRLFCSIFLKKIWFFSWQFLHWMIYCMSRQEVLTNCGSVGTGRRARLRILWAMRSCGFKSHLPHLTLGKPCKSQIYRAFLYFNFTMYSFFTRKSVLKFSERLTSIRKGYFHENCHVRSEIQASQTCAYLNWVILVLFRILW